MNTKSLPNESTLSTLKTFSFPSGDLLRTYRLAIATTGEFYQTNAAGILDMGQADMAVTTVIANLVNGVQNIYFDELAMAFELIPRL